MDGLLFDTETLSQEAIVRAAADGGHDVATDVFNRTIGLSRGRSAGRCSFRILAKVSR
jgi:beta-phosphoglucomutase-like phosphatase (HAD superfamily)